MQKDYLCDPDDYEVFINPTVTGGSLHHSVDWEYCLSFPNTRCSIKRPVSIKVSYIDELGNIIDQELTEFHARVFLKQLDHLNGKTPTHWGINIGKSDIIHSNYKHPDDKESSLVDHIS